MTGEPRAAARVRRGARLIVALIALLVLAAAASWWVRCPERAAERFVSLLSEGRLDEADAMLRLPSSIDLDAAGDVIVTAGDGSRAALGEAELPLAGLDEFYFRSRDGFGDYVAGRYRFPVVTTGPAVQSERREPVEVKCVATGDRIAIVAVERQ